jgi:hypothetical protein
MRGTHSPPNLAESDQSPLALGHQLLSNAVGIILLFIHLLGLENGPAKERQLAVAEHRQVEQGVDGAFAVSPSEASM